MKKQKTYDDFKVVIDQEIQKRRSSWTLSSINWLDFNDVAQLIRIHIHNKWDQYDQTKDIKPWVNTIISNQIKNLIRNLYSNYARPCLKCPAAEGQDLCGLYETQCSACPIYAKWEKTKKSAYNLKLPTSLVHFEANEAEVFLEGPEKSIDIDKSSEVLHEEMKKVLKPVEWKAYDLLFIKNKSETETAKLMGYKTTEKNRSPGYKMIKVLRASIIKKAKQILYSENIDLHYL